MRRLTLLPFYFICFFIWLTMGFLGCRDKMATKGVATATPTATLIATLTPLPIATPTPFVKPTLPPYILPTYLVNYHQTEGINWISGEPSILGVDSTSETVYLRAFSRNIVFLHGLLPTKSIRVNNLLYDWELAYGRDSTIYIPSYRQKKHIGSEDITIIQNEEVAKVIQTPIEDIGQIYYEPREDILYVVGGNQEGMMVAYRGEEVLKQWTFPGKTSRRISGDGRGHVYILLTRSVELTEKNEEGSMFQTLDSIATTIGTEEWHYVIEDHKRYLFFEADPVNHYLYHMEANPNRDPADGPWNEIWLMRDGKIILKQKLPDDIDRLDRVLPNPLTKEVYSSGPLLRNNEYYDGLFPVMTIENDRAVFHDPINLRVKEPYPHYIRWAFDKDQAILYGLDSDNQFVYVVRNNQYEGRFPVDCDHPHNIHVNSVTSLIYVSCNFEVRVFGYPELLSPKIQAQLNELERTAPDLLPKK